MEYLVNLYDYQCIFDYDDYYQLVTQYIKKKNDKVSIIFNVYYPYHLSVIFDDDENLREITERLERYFKLKSNTYLLDKGGDDIWGKQIEQKDGIYNLGIIGTYQTETKNILTYVNCSDHILVMPLEYDNLKQALHLTATHHQRIYNSRNSYPSIYVSKWGKKLHLYKRREEDKFTKEDLFQILDIKPAEHIFWDKLSLHISNEFCLQYEDEDVVVVFSNLSVRQDDLWGGLYITTYPKKRPIKLATYSKEILFYLGKYFDSMGERSVIQVKSNLIDINYINITSTYWLASLGGLLEDKGEEAIPKCFNPESIRKEYQAFQTYETLSKLKEAE